MNIALIGYGKMGKEIERIIEMSNKHKITSISYRERSKGLDIGGIKKSDVAIDFTSSEIVIDSIALVMKLNKPIVVGTTGWYAQLPQVKQIVKRNKGSLIYGQNFSIGANAFFNIIAYASKLLDQYKDYDVFGIETHHVNKKDSPSGTAKKIAETILTNFPRKKILLTEKLNRQIKSDELHVVSVRGGRNFGKHEVIFDSTADEISLQHQAWGRRGFAEGAIMAAEFIIGKAGVFDTDALFKTKGEQ